MRRTKQTDWIFSFLQILNLHISVHKQEIFCSIILFGIIFCIAAESKSQTCNPAPIGLAEWWTADSNAFGVRNRNNGTLLNGTTFVSGINGQAFSFDGVNDSVVITDSPSLDITGNQLTIEAWIKVDSTFSDYRQIVSMNNRKFGLFAQIGSGQLVFEVSTTDDYGLSGSNISIPPDRFVHVAGVYNGSTMITYIDGLATGSMNLTGNIISSAGNFTIGQFADGGFSTFKGLIDEVGIYNRALSATEIAQIAISGSSGKCKPTAIAKPSGLVGFWTGDGNANDSQGNNNGILSSGAGYAVGKVGQSFIFNGNSNSVIPNSAVLNPSTAITLEVWIKPTGGQNVHRDIFGKDGENFDRQYLLTVSEVNRLRAHIGTATQGFKSIDGATPVPLNVWTHAAMTYDGSTVRVYFNGVQDNVLAVSGAIISTTQPIRIGGGAPIGIIQYYFTGSIDEATIYNRALSAAEIKSISDAGIAGKFKSVLTAAGFAGVVKSELNITPESQSAVQTVVGDVNVTFPSIVTDGTTQQIPLNLSLLPSLPTAYVATGLSYDITTSAVFNGSPTLCFNLPTFNDTILFARLKVLHLENGTWIDRTTTSNFGTRTLCGQTSSLSPFAIADNFAPTAASVSVGGRVVTAQGRGISNARISVTDESGNTRTVLSNPFGYYRFDELPAGQTYIFQAQAKRYQFTNPTQVLSVNEEMNEVNFTASP